MITVELLKTALDTAHDQCNGDCIHADAITNSIDSIDQSISAAILGSIEAGLGPAKGVFIEGLHVGYRLAQLESQAFIKQTLDDVKGEAKNDSSKSGKNGGKRG